MTPVVAGKPYEPMADLRPRPSSGGDLDGAVMVGDRPDTDGRFARALGCRFGLVLLGGDAPPRSAGEPDPRTWCADDLAGLADQLLAAEGRRGWPPGAGSTPSWSGGAWWRAGPRRRPRSTPGG